MQSTTLVQSLDKYLGHFESRREKRTLDSVRHRITAWLRAEIPTVSTESFEVFRAMMIDQGQSPATIESTIAAVRVVTAYSGYKFELGDRLRLPTPDPDVPTAYAIGQLYRYCSRARWPRKLTAAKRADWWRAFIVLSSWSGYRLLDIERLTIGDIGPDCIKVRANKTKRFRHPIAPIPITHSLRRHLLQIKGLFGSSVFGLRTQRKQLRDSLELIAIAAQVKYVPPHGFRRFAITQWSAADSMAGKIIHGCSLGVMGHYIDIGRHLSSVAGQVEMPQEFLTDSELARIRTREEELIAAYRRATPDSRELIVNVARSVS